VERYFSGDASKSVENKVLQVHKTRTPADSLHLGREISICFTTAGLPTSVCGKQGPSDLVTNGDELHPREKPQAGRLTSAVSILRSQFQNPFPT